MVERLEGEIGSSQVAQREPRLGDNHHHALQFHRKRGASQILPRY
jgi:hypothetical protein